MRGCVALAASIACVALSQSAFAADVPERIASQFYASLHAGVTFDNRSHDLAYDTDPLTGDPLVGATFLSDSFSKPGYRVGAAVGRNWGNFALEGELSYASSTIDHVHLISTDRFPTPLDIPATGSGSTLTAMINAFLAADVGVARPCVGAGVGVGFFTAHNINAPPEALVPDPADRTILNGSDTGFAAQFLAGVDFAIASDMTRAGRHRYLYVAGLSLMDDRYKHDSTSPSKASRSS